MTLTFIQTPMFASQAKKLRITDDDIASLEQLILEFPERGDIMRGTGGIRKVRFAPPSSHSGKSGATRVCYVLMDTTESCYFLSIFAKNEKPNLSDAEKAQLKKWVEGTRKHSEKQ